MQSFKPSELSLLLNKAVSWSYRLIITGRSGSGSVEKAYCDTAVRIRKGELNNVGAIQKSLSDVIPADDEFINSFSVARITKDKVARYTLRAIENELQSQKNTSSELVTNADVNKVNLEHILPKKADLKEWGTFSEEKKSAYLYRIGNMTLLTGTKNQRLGTKPWSEKVEVYRESPLELNKMLGKFQEWSPATIDKRQNELAKLAMKIWK